MVSLDRSVRNYSQDLFGEYVVPFVDPQNSGRYIGYLGSNKKVVITADKYGRLTDIILFLGDVSKNSNIFVVKRRVH